MHTILLWTTAGVWVGLVFYWSIAAGKRAPAPDPGEKKRPWISVQFKRPGAPAGATPPRTGESAGSRSTHQMLLWGALLLSLLPWFFPLSLRWMPADDRFALAGLGVQLAFLTFYFWCMRHLGKYWSGAVVTGAEHKIIRTGPYRWLRHPMYTAMIGMFVGTALVSGEVHALLGLTLGMIAYARKIGIEERHLASVFGPEYSEYRRTSWALIPGIL